jgi:hypothetical protein
MPAHQPKLFTVLVRAYSLEAGRVGEDKRCVYRSAHRSAKAAGRRLATIINSRSKLARDVRKAAPRQGLEMVIVGPDACERPLNLHRFTFCR